MAHTHTHTRTTNIVALSTLKYPTRLRESSRENEKCWMKNNVAVGTRPMCVGLGVWLLTTPSSGQI